MAACLVPNFGMIAQEIDDDITLLDERDISSRT
jgi:hypothetical protein